MKKQVVKKLYGCFIVKNRRCFQHPKAFKEKCDELSSAPLGFNGKEEIINFITTWAPAYGIPVPKFYGTINSIEGLKEMKTLRADSLATIKRTFDSLQFYRLNNIPINDDWKICKHCGLPYNTAYIEDTVNNRFINICGHCDTVYHVDSAY